MGTSLRFDRNIINLRSFQHDVSNNVPRGNHNRRRHQVRRRRQVVRDLRR
jgi:hypothetical protein